MKGLFKAGLLAVGILMLLLGVWWILQGTGVVPVGFMAHHMQWAYRGMGLVAGGIILAVLARRI